MTGNVVRLRNDVEEHQLKLRRALDALADAFTYEGEPSAEKLRWAIELIDNSDPAGDVDVVESVGPFLITYAVNVLATLVVEAAGWRIPSA
jgi:hypothetical protein